MASASNASVDKELGGVSNGNIMSNSTIGSDMDEKIPDDDGVRDNDSSREEAAANEQAAPKNENLTAGLQVLGAFFLMFNTWGIANTYGAFQTYYEGASLSSQSPSNISWIGSIQAFLLLFVGGLCTGQIYDAGHLRGLVLVGSISAVFGMMMTSISHEYW